MANRIVNPERAFEVRAVDDGEPGRIEGYASVFGVIDSYGTIFDEGAFKKTIKDRKGQVPMVWMHEAWTPIGLASLSEDEKGLKFIGQLDLDVQRGAEVYSGIKKGYITEMSHSFKEVKSKPVKGEDGGEIIHYKEVKLFEISPVTTNFASNEEAVITGVRTEEPEEEPLVIPEGMRAQMDRLEALLNEPPKGTRVAEPQGKPGNHLQGVQRQLDRIEQLRGDYSG